jgi:hypothetical protein
MLPPFSPSELAEARAITVAVQTRAAAWRAGVDWFAGIPDRDVPRIYDAYPLLFAPAFPEIDRAQLADLVVASRLLSDSILALDAVVDEPADAARRAFDVAKAQSQQLEAHRILSGMFAVDSPFWDSLRDNFVTYLAAMQAERQPARRDVDEQSLLTIAQGKTAVARSCLVAMGLLGKRPELASALIVALGDFYLARQMWDDLVDWREDLANGQQSLLLSRALHELSAEDARNEHAVGVSIYYGGHADHVLAIAERAVARARSVVVGLDVRMAFERLLAQLADGVARTRRDLAAIIQRKQQNPGARPSPLPARPEPASVAADVLWSAAAALATAAPRAFGEARHWMQFPAEMGLESELCQSGDVFQRAIISDALCDLPAPLLASFTPVIDHELAYLLASRVSPRCGWSYLPELRELSADADTLAQVLQVAERCGRADHAIFESPVDLVLTAGSHDDGSFETWIYPAPDDREPVHHRQARFAETAWGTGPDVEVMANLLYALTTWDPDRFLPRITTGCRYILRQQHPSGCWPSSWYRGPFYGTYVVCRLLTAARVDGYSGAVAGAVRMLLHSQREDGSWSDCREPRALDTAHALLALARAAALTPTEEIRRSLARGIEALRSLRDPRDAWGPDEFIRMDCGRAHRGAGRILGFGSRTITAAYVLKAAAAVSNLEERLHAKA